MARLLFFSRVAFLCNLCFLVTLGMHYAQQMKSGYFVSTIIILGLVLSIVVNLLVNGAYLFVICYGKRLRQYVPLWLAVTNFLFFVLQAILLIK